MGQRSRKRRASAGERPAPPATPTPATPPAGDTMQRGYARGRERDQQIRAGLEPLKPGERPRAVTVGAIVAFVMALGNVAAAVAGVEVSNGGDATSFTIISTVLLLAAAGGMWFAKYWAVLGFEAILGLQLATVAMALLLGGIDGWRIAPAVIVLGLAGWLFWGLIRAMARLQMPQRHGSG